MKMKHIRIEDMVATWRVRRESAKIRFLEFAGMANLTKCQLSNYETGKVIPKSIIFNRVEELLTENGAPFKI